MNSSQSILSRYPALARASRLLDGPPPCAPRSHDLFDLGCELSRMARRAVARQGQSPAIHMAPDAQMIERQDDLDRRGVSGD